MQAGKHTRNYYVVLSPKAEGKIELEKLYVVWEHRLPSKEQLEEIACGITEESELPAGTELHQVLDAASGLTRYEAENTFGLSIIREGQIRPATVQQMKSQTLRKSGLLSLHESDHGFDQLGGMGSVKEFCTQVLNSNSRLARPRETVAASAGNRQNRFRKGTGQGDWPPYPGDGYRPFDGRFGWTIGK